MATKLSKSELVELVAKLLRADGSEEEQSQWIRLVESNVPDPHVQDLIFWPSRCGLGEDPSAEEIVEKALSYKPIAL